MKISIIGLAASGKSTLARNISQKYDIPHIHLDRFWFDAGGLETFNKANSPKKDQVRAVVRKKVEDAIRQPEWVSDGFYSRVQPMIAREADILVYLNISTWKRLWNHFKRIIENDRHRVLTLWDDIKFFKEIVSRKKKYQSRFNKILNEFNNKAVILRNTRQINHFFNSL